MKKLTTLVLALAMVFGLAACGNKNSGTTSKEDTNKTEKPKTVTIKSFNANNEETDLEVPYDAQRIAVMDMASLDILDSLGLGDRVVGSSSTSLDYLQAVSYTHLDVYKRQVLLESCGNGSSEMVSNLSMAIVTFLFNLTMLRLLGEDGVAAITIVLYGQFLFTSMYLGFSMGVAPVFSFNYGDKNYDQLKRIYKICMYFITVSSIVILVMALVFAEPIVGIFSGRDSRTYEIAADGFFLFSFNYIFAGINIFASAMFTAFGDGKDVYKRQIV